MKKILSHKSVIITILVSIMVTGLQLINLGQPAPARALDGMPHFQLEEVILHPDDLAYNPTDEIIFPSIIKAADYFSRPLAAYYLYYAPHDKPGGINLAYADSPDGPWTEYAHNPIISSTWQPHFQVSHISSPHAIWMEDQAELYLYFHGENSVTRLARSTDGLTFTYDSIVVSTADFNDISEASYARVFEYTIPARNNKYIMLLMGNNGGSRKIYLAWSDDGKTWTTQREPFISPTAAEGENIAGPYFYRWNGQNHVIYHASSGQMFITAVGANFDREKHLGLFYQDPRGIRSAAPTFYREGTVQYMFFERGSRGRTSIAIAKYDPTAPAPAAPPPAAPPVGQAGLLMTTTLLATTLLGGSRLAAWVRPTKTPAAPLHESAPPAAREILTYEARATAHPSGPMNEITVRSGKRRITLYLIYGAAGAVQDKQAQPGRTYLLDTTRPHDYRIVLHADETYDLYVDELLVWQSAPIREASSRS